MDDLIHCRTEALGGQLLPCDHCGQEHDVYHSCRHRSCPKCHRLDTEAWLADRRQELLPVPYVPVVLTLPQELRELVRRHQNDLDDMLLRAAAHALITLAADPHDVGGLIGVLCVLHTWTRTLVYHPHGHCLVPAGGVSADRTEWRPARPSSLVAVHALATLFRGLFLDLVRQERPDLPLPEVVWTKGWGVYCKPTTQGREQVLNYLGRYVHRIALTNDRLLSIADGQVCFRYQASEDQRWKTMTLPAPEFIRRFLPHVLPQGFHKVRYDGLWSPVHRPLLHQLQFCLAGYAAAEQHRHLMRIDVIVFGLAPVDGLHRERVVQDERNTLASAEVSQPVPGEDAFDTDHEVLPVGSKSLKKRFRPCLHVLVE